LEINKSTAAEIMQAYLMYKST